MHTLCIADTMALIHIMVALRINECISVKNRDWKRFYDLIFKGRSTIMYTSAIISRVTGGHQLIDRLLPQRSVQSLTIDKVANGQSVEMTHQTLTKPIRCPVRARFNVCMCTPCRRLMCRNSCILACVFITSSIDSESIR